VALTVFELRNYTVRPGGRDALIDLFEREFIESQEVLGARVAATFRNLDDPNRFVWIRGFETMETRRAALDGFYGGPVWQRLRNDANATIVDSDDVLLLRPIGGTAWAHGDRAPLGATATAPSMLVAITYVLKPEAEAAFPAFFADDIAPALRDGGGDLIATLATEHSPNSYPRLPVRAGEHVFVVLLRYASVDAHIPNAGGAALNADAVSRFAAAPGTLRLQPTARSALR
jgi:hypothetical protein